MNEQEHQLVTWEDIQRAALHDPFLQRAVTWVDLNILTREQALMEVAISLSGERQRLLDALQQGLSRE
jgi:hypothetical protein